MRFETTNEPITTYRNMNSDNEIDLNASYQRGSVWTHDQKSKLISSVLSKYCISNIFYRNIKYPNKTVREIIDGKQRLSALFDYRNDKFKLTGCPDIDIDGVIYKIDNKLFNELDEVLRRSFDSYKIASTEFCDATEEEIREQFRRTNNGSAMNPAEKRYAMLGCVSDVINNLINHEFVKKVFTKNKRDKIVFVERMIYLHLNDGTIVHGFKQSVFDDMHKMHRENDKEIIIENVAEILNNFNKIFASSNEQFLKTIKQFSHGVGLFVLIREYGHLLVDTKQFLNCYRDYLGQEDSLRVAAGLDLKKNAIGDKVKAIAELKIMRDFFEKYIQDGKIILKPKQRFFSAFQKKELEKKAQWICFECGADVTEKDYHADHIIPQSKGGKTEIDNGQILCVECNLKKSDKQLELIVN